MSQPIRIHIKIVLIGMDMEILKLLIMNVKLYAIGTLRLWFRMPALKLKRHVKTITFSQLKIRFACKLIAQFIILLNYLEKPVDRFLAVIKHSLQRMD